MTRRKYVVAFAGARDAYQVPLALEEAGLLERLVTDFYLSPTLVRVASSLVHSPWMRKAANRSKQGLPFSRVSLCSSLLWPALASAPRGVAVPSQHLEAARRGQAEIGNLVAAVAAKTGADLFLYAGYAEQAFAHAGSDSVRKVLFVYHPHIRPSAAILRKDMAKYPVGKETQVSLDHDLEDESNDRELAAADLVVCASSFTARTVKQAGFASTKIVVVPYGTDAAPTRAVRRRENQACRFLFVGSGVHRKGLHHLAEAWKKAALPNAELTIISRAIEPWLEEAVVNCGAQLIRGASPEELERRYETCDVFVLPSLIEGFGYVYLEALLHGCYCIGTENTGLPDLALSAGAGAVIPAGDVDALVQVLRSAHARWRERGLDAPAIAREAAPWTWKTFRTAIADTARGGTS